jgi:hypothetical protein
MLYGEKIWVVVLVESGIPISVEVFRNFIEAKKREKVLRSQSRPDNDEIGFFELPLGNLLSASI